MKKLTFSLPHILRLGVVFFLFAVVVIIAVSFITRVGVEEKVKIEQQSLGEKKIEEKRNIVHFETKREKGTLKVKAEKHFLGEDGLYHLEGNVEVVFLKRREGKDVFLYGDKIVYDQNWRHFVLSGKAKLKFEDLLIKSPYLEYRTNQEIFRSDKTIEFTSPHLEGSAAKVYYSLKTKNLILKGRVRLKLTPKLKTSQPILVEAEELDYSQEGGQGILRDQVKLIQGQSRASADKARFQLEPDKENLQSLHLRGEVKATLFSSNSEEKETADSSFLTLYKEKRTIEAEEVDIQGYKDISQVKSLKTKGNCSLEFSSARGDLTQIQAQEVEFVLDTRGELESFHSCGEVRITEHRRGQQKKVVKGELVELEGEENKLKIEGKEGFKPQIMYKNYQIKGKIITIYLDSNDLEAIHEVEAVLEPVAEESISTGFFSEQVPVFISAQEMRYFEEGRRFIFKGEVKVWQEKKMLWSEEFSFSQSSGEMECVEGVKSILPYYPSQREEQRIEISAHLMKYTPEERTIFFEEDSILKLEKLTLKAQSLFLHLEEEKAEVREIVGENEVHILQDQSEATGEKARMNVNKEWIILLGNPVLIDKDRGEIKGDKLTFHIPDDRIVVENKDRERSITIVKSEK